MSNNKRRLSLLLAATMLASTVVGCSGGTASSTAPAASSTAPAASSAAPAASSTAPAANEKPAELTVFSELNGKSANTVTSYEDTASMQEVEKLLNIDITWQHPPIGQQNEQFNLMVASQDLPDVIWWSWNSYPGGPEKAVLDGVIAPFNDYMDKAPNLQALFDEFPEVYKQTVTDEGTLYMFPFYREACMKPEDVIWNCWFGPAYRQDLADSLKLEKPETLDDWYNTLVAFRDAGYIPYTGSGVSALYNLAVPFGVMADFYMEGSAVSHGLLQPEFKNFVETMAKWYAEGLIDPDILANDGNAFKAKVTEGKAASYIGSQGGNYVTFSKVLETTVPEAMLVALPWPVGPEGVAYNGQSAVNHVNAGAGLAITPKCRDIDAAMRFCDFGYSDEGAMLLNYGIEGLTYNMENGKAVWTPDIRAEMDEKGVDFVISGYAFGGVSSWSTMQLLELGNATRTYRGQMESCEIWGASDKSLCMPPVSPSVDEASQVADIMNRVNTYRDETLGKMIMGQIPLSEYDSFIAEVKKMGLEDAVKIYNDALARYNAR